MQRWTRQNSIVAGLVMVGIVFLLWSVMMFRDYRLELDGGMPVFVARIGVPRPSSMRIDNSEPKKLTVTTASLGSQVAGYEFRISRFRSMAFAHSYRSVDPKKTIAKLHGETRYYLQARCYKTNKMGRIVFGRWGMKSSAFVKEE